MIQISMLKKKIYMKANLERIKEKARTLFTLVETDTVAVFVLTKVGLTKILDVSVVNFFGVKVRLLNINDTIVMLGVKYKHLTLSKLNRIF